MTNALRPYRMEDRDTIRALIEKYPLATLLRDEAKRPLIAYVPLVLDNDSETDFTLLGHLARSNPFADHADIGKSTRFFGPDAYI